MKKINHKDSEKILDSWAMIFGNKDIRKLGKQNSVWFEKIFASAEGNEPGFSELILALEFRFENIISKEDLFPTTSLLLIKHKNKTQKNRNHAIVEFFNSNQFDNYCKEIFYFIKENANNGNH